MGISTDGDEEIFLDQAVTNGVNALAFTVPAGTFDGVPPNRVFNARFRLYSSSTGGLAGPTGYSSNGEVEDYQWTFTPTAISLLDLTAQPARNQLLIWVVVGLSALALSMTVLPLAVRKVRTSNRVDRSDRP